MLQCYFAIQNWLAVCNPNSTRIHTSISIYFLKADIWKKLSQPILLLVSRYWRQAL